MIVFDLKCSADHVFEAWFGSRSDYEDQRARGLVECPLCGCAQLEKALVAPRLGSSAGDVGGEAKQALAALADA